MELTDIADALKAHIKSSKEPFLKKRVSIKEISIEEIIILSQYFTVGFNT